MLCYVMLRGAARGFSCTFLVCPRFVLRPLFHCVYWYKPGLGWAGQAKEACRIRYEILPTAVAVLRNMYVIYACFPSTYIESRVRRTESETSELLLLRVFFFQEEYEFVLGGIVPFSTCVRAALVVRTCCVYGGGISRALREEEEES